MFCKIYQNIKKEMVYSQIISRIQMRWCCWVGLFWLLWNMHRFERWLFPSGRIPLLSSEKLTCIFLSRLALKTELMAMGTLDFCVSSVMIEELYGGLYTLFCWYQIININMSPVVLCGALCHLFCKGWNGEALSKSRLVFIM